MRNLKPETFPFDQLETLACRMARDGKPEAMLGVTKLHKTIERPKAEMCLCQGRGAVGNGVDLYPEPDLGVTLDQNLET